MRMTLVAVVAAAAVVVVVVGFPVLVPLVRALAQGQSVVAVVVVVAVEVHGVVVVAVRVLAAVQRMPHHPSAFGLEELAPALWMALSPLWV